VEETLESGALSNLEMFRGRRVLVTGDTGFNGSWLCAWLLELGADVSGIALPAERREHFDLLGLAEKISHVDCDIRDAAHVRQVIEEAQPEVVFHLAAQALVRASYSDPIGTFATNVLGTAHVLDALRHSSTLRAVVVVTSDKCYENREWVYAYRESDAMGGHDPYSASKGAAELVVSSFRRSFFDAANPRVGLATSRAGNVIGGGDFAEDRLVPDCARTLLQGKELVLRHPQAVRPWQHVLEPLWGYMLLAARLLDSPESFSDAYNFGPSEFASITVEQIARAFHARLGTGQVRIEHDSTSPHEAQLLSLACDKARAHLGWMPALSTDETLDWTVRWYEAFRQAPAQGKEMTIQQIAEYQRRLTVQETQL
jgi:CDP-glucose 4,6-dehydratase